MSNQQHPAQLQHVLPYPGPPEFLVLKIHLPPLQQGVQKGCQCGALQPVHLHISSPASNLRSCASTCHDHPQSPSALPHQRTTNIQQQAHTLAPVYQPADLLEGLPAHATRSDEQAQTWQQRSHCTHTHCRGATSTQSLSHKGLQSSLHRYLQVDNSGRKAAHQAASKLLLTPEALLLPPWQRCSVIAGP